MKYLCIHFFHRERQPQRSTPAGSFIKRNAYHPLAYNRRTRDHTLVMDRLTDLMV